uniref:Cardiolipin synthase (CMP-forming), mitochondrial n=1 Tax=Ananas comosus var. bracteatus TaxID=296719 RepID=A0A6V7PBD4_ANACO|nr:unnamed protein product [Ananas comosus var. bracteatus]
MAIFKTLRSLFRNPNPRSLLSFYSSSPPFPLSSSSSSAATAAAVAAADPFSFVLRLTSAHSALFSPLLSPAASPTSPGPSSSPRPQVGRGVVGGVIGWRKERSVGGEVGEIRVDEKFLNLPNLVSISRLVSGPVIGWMIINEWYLPAFGALVISGATDWLDGFLARRMGINSVFGSYLDPLADKVLIGCVALAMVKKDLLHPGLVGLVILRDVALVSGAVYRRASILGWQWNSWSDFVNLDANHREKVEPLFISKAFEYRIPTGFSCSCSSSTRIRHCGNPIVYNKFKLVGGLNYGNIMGSLWSAILLQETCCCFGEMVIKVN